MDFDFKYLIHIYPRTVDGPNRKGGGKKVILNGERHL